ncbi:hypothetical protein HPB47_005911 [Ixodes persulcatus]|uniref:Uncharacterized protein n=1 Tax=Ixodes persulcatus TaxID=34615 RepID=A0AC60PC05_IXOPE|nr:hypothetical protein HPB47_005911 [Ixodes persulcatus]
MIFLRLGYLLLVIGAVLAGDAEQKAADQQQGAKDSLGEASSDIETKVSPDGADKVFQQPHYHQGGGYPLDGIPIPVHQIPIQSGHIILPQLLNNGLQQGPIHLSQWESNKKPPQPVFDHQQGHIPVVAYPEIHHQPTQVVHHGGGQLAQEESPQHHQYIENHNVHPQTDHGPHDAWPLPQPEVPKIVHLDVKCEKNLMKVVVEFDTPFHGIIFSKGHYSYGSCVHLPAGSGRKSVYFDVSINSCGTIGNTQNGLYGHDGGTSGTGSFFENTIIVQYDPQIQAGKGPWASEVAGIVKIGQTMTMVLAIKDDENKFDMLVRNCIAHDGQRAPIELVDSQGCVVRSKLMSRFTKIRNFGSSATVLSYAHFQAFKFPDTMEVHFQCTIQICRYQCPDQCSAQAAVDSSASDRQVLYSNHVSPPAGRPREERDVSIDEELDDEEMAEIGVNRVIRVVSAGDLAFSLGSNDTHAARMIREEHESSVICMSAPGFASALVVLLSILVIACLLSAFLWVKQKTASRFPKGFPYDLPVFKKGKL